MGLLNIEAGKRWDTCIGFSDEFQVGSTVVRGEVSGAKAPFWRELTRGRTVQVDDLGLWREGKVLGIVASPPLTLHCGMMDKGAVPRVAPH